MNRMLVLLSCLMLPPLEWAAAGDDGPHAAARHETAADAVQSAWKAKDASAMAALAAKDDPDPWLVADELMQRGEHDAAAGFAQAAPRLDVEALPAHVAARRGRPDEGAPRALLAKAEAARAAGGKEEVLAILGAGPGTLIEEVTGVRIAMVRGFALAGLGRWPEAHAAHLLAGEGAERIGWWARAQQAFGEAATAAHRGGALAQARTTAERTLALCDRRRDLANAATAAGFIGGIEKARGDRVSALGFFERALASARASDARLSEAALLGRIAVVQMELGNTREALASAGRSLSISEALGHKSQAAVALGIVGMVHNHLGDLVEAASAYEQALAAHEALGNQVGAAAMLIDLGSVHRALGNTATALSSLERGLALAQSAGHRTFAARALGNMGVLYTTLGRYDEALAAHGRSMAEMKALGDRGGEAGALVNIGIALQDLGDLDKAIAHFQRGLALAEAAGAGSFAAHARGGLGRAHALRGDFGKALTYMEGALAGAEAREDKAAVARALVNIGTVYATLGDDARALAFFERALGLHRKIGHRAGVAAALDNIGTMHRTLGDPARALETFEQALAEYRAVGDRIGEAGTLVNIGTGHQDLLQHREALPWLERGLALAEEIGHRQWAANAMENIALVHHELGESTKAFGIHEQSLAATEALGDTAGMAKALANMARAHLRLGDAAEALWRARESVRLIDTLPGGLGAEAAAGARERFASSFALGATAALALRDPGELCFFLESGRAGALLEGLGAREALWSAVVPVELRAEESMARAAEAAAVRASQRAHEARDIAQVRARRAELESARERVAAVVARIQREAKAGAALVCPRAAGLADIQGTLVAGDVLVLYGMPETGACALVVTNEATRIVELGEGVKIREAVANLEIEALDARAGQGLTALSKLIAEPLALPSTTQRLLISPADVLGNVPFAAIFPQATVTYVPSGTTYRLLREEGQLRGAGVLALGDPDYEAKSSGPSMDTTRGGMQFARLPATRLEAQAIGNEVLLGGEATEDGLEAAVAKRARWRAVHLACHGLVNTARPARSALVLTAAGEDDGFLTCLDLFRAKIPADLVVLSACETSKGQVLKTEGIVGLTRAFMFAGAPRVICSLWKVDDEATRALMIEFYARWNPKSGAGASASEALRAAQAFVRDHPDHPEWNHPYYWAAWVLWGLPD